MSALSALANYTDDEEEEENEVIESTNIATSEQKGFNASRFTVIRHWWHRLTSIYSTAAAIAAANATTIAAFFNQANRISS